jgi:hypothetical protein
MAAIAQRTEPSPVALLFVRVCRKKMPTIVQEMQGKKPVLKNRYRTTFLRQKGVYLKSKACNYRSPERAEI